MVTTYFRRVRDFFGRNYHQHVRVDGERAMDNLMGTMIGVLFLAVISVSFAGIFMAYTVSTAKAGEDTSRTNAVGKYSTDTLNNLYIESVGGKTAAANAGWTVLSQLQPLNTVSPALNPNAAFTAYTFAATRTLTPGGSLLISQWGKNENGIVTIYTAVPKAGSTVSKCDWTEDESTLEKVCVVAIDSVQSVVSPPVGVTSPESVLWANYINKYPWTASASDWASSTPTNVTTSKLGVINLNGTTEVKYVAMFSNLTPGKTVALDFVESTNGSIMTHTFTPTTQMGETGNLTRSTSGVIDVPSGTATLSVYLDTDYANSNTPTDQTVKLYSFNVYTMK